MKILEQRKEPVELLKRYGWQIRILSAYEELRQFSMAKKLVEFLVCQGIEREEAEILADNACLLSGALCGWRGSPVFSDGEQVIKVLTGEQISCLTEEYAACKRKYEKNGEWRKFEKEILVRSGLPEEQIRWEVLKFFRILPSSPEAKNMEWTDYLYCYTQIMKDRENTPVEEKNRIRGNSFEEWGINESFPKEALREEGKNGAVKDDD